MTTALRDNIKGVSAFYHDVEAGSYRRYHSCVRMSPTVGHPADSRVSAYEYFVMSIVNATMKNHALFDDTAIVVTFDEGGGYYDSGYIQTLDFFRRWHPGSHDGHLAICPPRATSITPTMITARF